jgi:multidrug efflux pump subunit AcrA (membrane-fusion protein)
MKHIFSKIAKIGEEVRSGQPMKVEFNALSELKSLQSVVQSASDKASGQLDAAITALRAAQKAAESALAQARKAQAMAKELGVDEGQFNGWEKQFVQSRDSFDSAISAIARIQNSI